MLLWVQETCTLRPYGPGGGCRRCCGTWGSGPPSSCTGWAYPTASRSSCTIFGSAVGLTLCICGSRQRGDRQELKRQLPTIVCIFVAMWHALHEH